MDQLLGADAATCVTGLEERVSLQAQECVRVAPSAMLTRLLADFEDVKSLLKQPVGQPLGMRLYEVAADLSVLVGDELMVLGRPADSQAWYTTAKAAATRTGSPRTRARALEPECAALPVLRHPDQGRCAGAGDVQPERRGSGNLPRRFGRSVRSGPAGQRVGRSQRAATQHGSVSRTESGTLGLRLHRPAPALLPRPSAAADRGLAEAQSALTDALSSYPLDVVGDPAVLRLDLAERLVTEGDLVEAAELAVSVLDELRPEHRAGLFTDAGRRVLTGVVALGRHHAAVEQLAALTAKAS